jgi:two-component system response regulator AlgR
VVLKVLKVLIVDDEALARLRLRSLLEELRLADPPLAVEVVAEAGDALGAIACLQRHSVDAVLLDIQLPGNSGMQLAARLRETPDPPALVFVTAHAEHAVQAFELAATDYLTKPVRRERLLAALQRVQERRALRHTEAPKAPPDPGAAAPATALVISERDRTLQIPLADVLYLKAELKYVILRTAVASHVLDDALADLELKLQALGGEFLRVHRNALVARHAIRELALDREQADGWAVRVAPLDEWLSVSRRQVTAVRAALLAVPS